MIVIHFVTALWCPSCLIMRPRYATILKQHSDWRIIEHDYDFDESYIEQEKIGKILPVAIFVDGDREVLRLIGEKSLKEISKMIQECL
ncbi:MAG: thioredoxin family protein [Bacilli bacterium]|jgi:thiol-disulfide isomerase/thioredoxin